MFTADSIKKYYRTSAYGASMQKGLILYRQGMVRSYSVIDKQNIDFSVQGTYLYEVSVSEDGKIKTSCNCQYNYGGICKHVVAALLHLEFVLLNEPDKILKAKASKVALRNTSEWHPIGKFSELYEKMIIDKLDHKTKSSLYDRYSSISNIKLQGFSNGVISLNYGYTWEQMLVSFRLEEGVLETKCDCMTSVKGYCIHQANTFIRIFQQQGSRFFECLTPDFIQKQKSETFEKYGLSENINFDDFFTLGFVGGKPAVLPTKKGKRLVPVAGLKSSESFVPYDFLHDNEIVINAHVSEQAESNYEVAYVFCFQSDEYYISSEGKAVIELIPIYGKTDKTGTNLANTIRELSQREVGHRFAISDFDERLIRLSKNVNFERAQDFYTRNNAGVESQLHSDIILNKYYISVLDELIPLLKQAKFLFVSESRKIIKSKLTSVTIAEEVPEVIYKLTADNDFIKLKAYLKIGDEVLNFSSRKVEFHGFILFTYNQKLYYLNNIKTALTISHNLDEDIKEAPLAYAEEFFDKYVIPISEYYPVSVKTKLFQLEDMKEKAMKKQLYISEMGTFIMFKPIVEYESGNVQNILKKETGLLREGKKVKKTIRDVEFEDNFNKLLKSTHPKFNNQFPEEFYYLDIDSMIKNYWFYDAFETLRNDGVEIFGMDKLKNFSYSTHKANVSIQIASGQDWFDVDLNVKFGDYEISLNDIKKAMIRKENFVRLGDGTKGILPQEWLTKFERYFRHGQVKKDGIKISKLRFSLIDELFDQQSYTDIMVEILEKKRKLKEFEEIKSLQIPKQITATLRDYQKFGYNWLNFLDEFSWGGILADDMGLGKTIQVLSFLQSQAKKSTKANLIIVPTTLLFNWQNEIKKFSPELTVHFHYGTDRAKDHKEFKDFNLIITTYGLLINDIEVFRKYKFNYVILDESQAIKNPASKRFKAASLINAQNKIAMTGTPIENNTFDLYAQMDFVNPGLLGSQAQFKEDYSNPIDRDGDSERAAELQQIISPFVLRRTKEQVATELPEKTEDFIYCSMEPEQRKVYEAFRNKYRDFLLNKIDTEGLGKSKLYVLEGLTKLRQICDSPQLLPGEEDYGDSSVKIKELVRHIKEKTARHKILVFSQFVKMLKLIENHIQAEDIRYEYLDGQRTKNARQQSVDNFQNNPDVRVFLISLKAGGTGINLTEADYVYIVDPWWNPAVENQAIDRCHRIGQSKKVIAYRMICKDTIEEKIMLHQDKKRKIASDIITTDEGFVKNLTKEDISALFE